MSSEIFAAYAKTILCLHISKPMFAEKSIKSMDGTARRTFVKLAAFATPSATSFGSLAAWGMAPDLASGKAIQAWLTSGKARCEPIAAHLWRNDVPPRSNSIPRNTFRNYCGSGTSLQLTLWASSVTTLVL